MENKYCNRCGAEMLDEAKFCIKCGQSFEENIHENKLNKKSLYALLIVFAILLLIIFGAMFYSEYAERREARIAREEFVQDSIKRAKIAEEEMRLIEEEMRLAEEARIKEEKEAAQFLGQFSFEKFISLLKNIEGAAGGGCAQKCGLSLIYDDKEDVIYEGDPIARELVYGREIEKGNKKGVVGYVLISNSEHSCYFKYSGCTSAYAELGFHNQDDANLFFEKAENYGLVKYGDYYGIPKKKLPNRENIEVDSLDRKEDYAPIFLISEPAYQEGFYVFTIRMDF